MYISEDLENVDRYELYSKINKEFKRLRPILHKLNEKYQNRFEGQTYLEYTREFDEFYKLVVEEVNSNSYYGANSESDYFISFFNQYANFLENQSFEIELIPVEVHLSNQLTLDNVRESLDACDLHMQNGSYDVAVTTAKTVLESVFKEIIRTECPEFLNEHKTFPRLKKKAFDILELTTNNDAYTKDLKKMGENISTIADTVTSICEAYEVYNAELNKLVGNVSTTADMVNSIRNKVGMGHEAIDKPTASQALLVVNSAKTVATFILQTFDERNKKVMESINE